MSLLVLLPVASGVLLAFGQFFMKRLAGSIPPSPGLGPLFYAVVLSPYLYEFLIFNVVATVTYIASLRYQTMTNTFAVVFLAMGATVLALDVIVNRIALSTFNIIGVGLGIIAVLLIAAR